MNRFKFYLFFSGLMLLGCFGTLFAQNRTISGTVADEKGELLPGVSLSIKGTTLGTNTNVEGRFTLSIPANATTLVVSFVGMQTQEIPVTNESTYTIVLQSDSKSLDEVVVIGYGSARKSDLTGSVASIKSEQLTQIATPNVTQAIQGRVAGVDVTANSGEPGGASRIRIRGVGTINNSDPLYVVDGFQTGDISFLAPTDIASMEILKDASATAIYGSRGANGVVLITTKRGRSGPTRFTLDGYAGVQNAWNKLNMLNAAQYGTLRLEAYRNDGTVLDPNGAEYRLLNNAAQTNMQGTDWQKEVMQSGSIQNYSLNVLGGTEKSRYSLTGTYFGQDGIVKNSSLRKYFLRFNNDYTFNNWLTGGISGAFSRTNKTFTNNDLFAGVLTTALRAEPITPAWNPETNNWGRTIVSQENNPARAANEMSGNKGYESLLNANAYVEASFLKHFKLRSQFGVNYKNVHNKQYLPEFFLDIKELRPNSQLTEYRSEQTQWVSSTYLTYDNDFGKHHVGGMIGTEAQRSTFDNIGMTAYNVPANTDLRYLSSSRNPNVIPTTTPPSDESLLSFFGRANYSYNEKYMLTATLRYDGSSRFLKGNRWGIFPAFAFGWNVTDEPFMANIKAISNLKVRAGWGQVGNQNSANNYGYVTTISGGNRYVFGDQIVEGFAPTMASNPNLKWETTTSSNIGIDADFFNHSLSLTADYFIKNTADMIVRVPVPVFIGVGPPYVNAGSMRNNGIELALNYRNEVGAFRYDVGVNFTKIKNEVTSLGGGTGIESANVISNWGNITRTSVGREIAYFYGLKTDGIFKTQEEANAYNTKYGIGSENLAKAGDVRFVDANNDGVINDKDRVYLGSATPKFSYGFNATLGYKNFDLRLFFQGVQGVEVVNALDYFTRSSMGTWNSVTDRLNRWTPENTNTNEPRMTAKDANANYRFSDRFVQSGDYLRLRNVTLGYTIPKVVTDRWKMSTVRAYVSVDNLLTVTGYKGLDPEIGEYGYNRSYNPLAVGVDVGTYPQPQTWRAGLTLNF
ncbi:SusC/RagA family TonB-linked outer membrane protein [Siphonobacter curvatus]|uniref:TonB-dependent receptor n=1 Tax=Siphonobacter curvatus TaxID=2094562 RepID=A0A2S7IND1_9BACT|nr:TonB-dependent receptor [Siphonobacter curvatus]PQA59243.1 TonB-dependent receptor [Siphonobacter curvatus]